MFILLILLGAFVVLCIMFMWLFMLAVRFVVVAVFSFVMLLRAFDRCVMGVSGLVIETSPMVGLVGMTGLGVISWWCLK